MTVDHRTHKETGETPAATPQSTTTLIESPLNSSSVESAKMQFNSRSPSTQSEAEDVFMAVEALGKLRNGGSEVSSPSAASAAPAQETTFLDKVTSHPLISNSIKMIEKNIQDNKRRWFQEEPQKLQNLKELGIANFNIESRRKLQMLINFLKLGNRQLNLRIENLSKVCEQERLKKLKDSNPEQGTELGESPERDVDHDQFHDATDTLKTTELNTSKSPTPPPQQQEIKSEIVGTVKKIVKVVSKFTGNSLPEPARTHVREMLLKLPNNWALQKELNNTKDPLDPNGKVLLLAQESLEMIKKILNLCNENLNSLENWNCLKVEEQKFLKEKILIRNHQYYVINEGDEGEKDVEESVGKEKEDEAKPRLSKRHKIEVNDLVNEK